MPSITIPNPAGATFFVSIVDASNNVVYTGLQTNSPFDPGITDPGEYTVYVEHNGSTNGFCFTIPPCECYIPTDAVITESGGVRTVVFTFDIADVENFCPFIIHINQSGGSSGALYPVHVLSLTDLTLVSGTTYTKTITIYPWNTSVAYQTFRYHAGESYDVDPCMAGEQTVFFECISPEALISDISVYNDQDTGDTYLRIGFQNNCDDATCDTVTVNYLQIGTGSGAHDSGSYTFTPDCSNFPAVTYNDLLLSPNPDIDLTYRITMIGCCGMLLNNVLILCQGVPDADISTEILLIASTYVLRVSVNSCGVTCHNLRISGTQFGVPVGGGSPNLITITNLSIDCDASFPQTVDISLSPNPSAPSVKYNVALSYAPCCFNGVPTRLVTYTP